MTQATPTPLQEMQQVRNLLKERAAAKPSYASLPKSAVSLENRRELRPGSRLAAKLLDIVLISVILQFAISFAYPEAALPGLLVFALFPLVEAVMLCVFGATPGKALFALSLTTKQGGRPQFDKLLGRSYLCWFYGLAMGIPLVCIFTTYRGRKYLLKNGICGWDSRTGLLLVPRQVGDIREALTIAASLILYLGVLLTPAITALGTNAT